MTDTDTALDLITEAKELLLKAISNYSDEDISFFLLPTELNYLIKLIKNDLGEKNG